MVMDGGLCVTMSVLDIALEGLNPSSNNINKTTESLKCVVLNKVST
jgi:hypothetical protein